MASKRPLSSTLSSMTARVCLRMSSCASHSARFWAERGCCRIRAERSAKNLFGKSCAVRHERGGEWLAGACSGSCSRGEAGRGQRAGRGSGQRAAGEGADLQRDLCVLDSLSVAGARHPIQRRRDHVVHRLRHDHLCGQSARGPGLERGCCNLLRDCGVAGGSGGGRCEPSCRARSRGRRRTGPRLTCCWRCTPSWSECWPSVQGPWRRCAAGSSGQCHRPGASSPAAASH